MWIFFKKTIDKIREMCYIINVLENAATLKSKEPPMSETTQTQQQTQVIAEFSLPSILTAKCYFWSPSGTASGRRSNERRKEAEVAVFAAEVAAVLPGTDIDFDYTESCKIVYKHVTYRIPTGSTNLTGYIGYAKRHGVIINK